MARRASSISTSTVVTSPYFNANVYATILEKKCDTKTIIYVVASRGIAQRIEIAEAFRLLQKKDLRKKLKKELNGYFADTVIALMTPLPEFYAIELHEAIMGVDVSKSTIIEILCTLSNFGIKTVAENYENLYKRKIETDLMSVTSGYFQRLCIAFCLAAREKMSAVNANKVLEDARTLHETGVGTNELKFIDILTRRSYQHLRCVFSAYRKIGGTDIETFINSEFSGDISKALSFLVKCIKNKVKFFAKRLHKSMVGLKTTDKTLIRIIVSRSEIDLRSIKEAFFQLYGKDLSTWITTATSGDYQQLLLKIVG